MPRYLKYRSCAAVSCRQIKEKEPRLFKFPMTKLGKRRYQVWADIAKNPLLNQEKMMYAFLCARHFARDQFRDADCTRLIWGAVPTIEVTPPPQSPSQDVDSIQENDEPSPPPPSFTLHDDIANLQPDLVMLWELKEGIASSGKELINQLDVTIDRVNQLNLKCREDEKLAAAVNNPSPDMQLESQRLKRLSLYLSMVRTFLKNWKDREEKEIKHYLSIERKMNWLNKLAVVVVNRDPNELNRALEMAQNMA